MPTPLPHIYTSAPCTRVHAGIQDACIEHLTALTNLSILHLRHCRALSDGRVNALARALPELSAFELHGCWGVSMDTINALYRMPRGGGQGSGSASGVGMQRGCRVELAHA